MLAVAHTLALRSAAPPHLDHDPGEAAVRGESDTELTDEQWSAVRGAFGARISVLTGGPGVGRRPARGRSSEEAENAHLRVALRPDRPRRAPPRGGHRPLGADDPPHARVEPGREPAFKPGHPLPVDLVIVDESSMLNLRLIEVLLGGLAESTHVVFVGDADQLPPIGAGKPFEDLIESGIAPVVRLTQIFRQAARR